MQGEPPAVCDKHALALTVQAKVLPKDEETSEDWSLAADALFGQNIVVIEVFDGDAAVSAATKTINATAACICLQSKMGREHAAVTFYGIRENDQPATKNGITNEGKEPRRRACRRNASMRSRPASCRVLDIADDKGKPSR